ncbi:hypothetical protein FNV43_RR07329 [Rhamnella rubrinervis]|uniref:Uncharacterized protein n=1 Tax=Rhamnella rubrinervis TaxID=2594499 RepID=A0A8K0MMA7_9ROSA|nr:hypothetical protein FNV43_RR07329 [Rhamnella rubrinervis]
MVVHTPRPMLATPCASASHHSLARRRRLWNFEGIGALILVALSGGCGWRYVKEQGKHVVAQQRAGFVILQFLDKEKFNKTGLLKAKAIAVVAPTWLVLFLLSLVKNLAWKQGMQNIHAFVVMIIVWNFPDQVAYADLVAAGSLAAAREKGLVSIYGSIKALSLEVDVNFGFGDENMTLKCTIIGCHICITIVYNNLCFDVNLDAENELVSWCCGSSYNVNARGNPLRSRLGLFLKREKVEAILFGDDHVGCCRKKPTLAKALQNKGGYN